MVDLSRFRAVIFDFDGVVVDSETMQARAWTRVARELGPGDREIAARDIAGRLDLELAAELFPGFDARRCAELKARIEAEMEACGELRIMPGIEPLVRRLAETHALAICSSCRQEPLVRRLERLGLDALFRVVVGRTDGVRHKPAPDLYLLALEGLGISSHEACAIEDSPTGVLGAKRAGIHVVQLLHPYMPRSPDADEWLDAQDLARAASGTSQGER